MRLGRSEGLLSSHAVGFFLVAAGFKSPGSSAQVGAGDEILMPIRISPPVPPLGDEHVQRSG